MSRPEAYARGIHGRTMPETPVRRLQDDNGVLTVEEVEALQARDPSKMRVVRRELQAEMLAMAALLKGCAKNGTLFEMADALCRLEAWLNDIAEESTPNGTS